MQVLPVDLTAIVAIVMGVSVVLVPIIGLTARFALKPLVESLSHFFQGKGVEESVRILERRMSLMEQQLEAMNDSVERLTEVTEFHNELRRTSPGEALPPGREDAGSPAATREGERHAGRDETRESGTAAP